ncbi:ATP-binding protein [Chitinilyticum litopenaei]|uniref:ATP-binding protein n=1 Tax=Chitinilyticum litopenaei TaxID=1121276 RepID=UPI000425F7E6|nr:ATP-binding protein [Chitinilyticum litopenaei]
MPIPTTPAISELLASIAAIPVDRLGEARQQCESGFLTARLLRDYAGFVALAEHYSRIMDTLGQAVHARDPLYEALQIAESLHLFAAEARLLEAIGRSHYVEGEYRSALQFWARCLEVASLAHEWTSLVLARIGLGMIHDALQDHAKAVAIHRDALQLIRDYRLDSPMLEAKARINLGRNLMLLGQLDEAEAEYQHALTLCAAHGLHEFHTESCFRLAETRLAQDHLDGLQTLLDETLARARSAGYRWTEVHTVRLLAQLAERQGNYPRALPLFEEAIGFAEAIANRHLLASILLDAAHCAEVAGDPSLALRYCQRGHAMELAVLREAAPERMGELESWAGLNPSSSQRLLELSNSSCVDQGDLEQSFELLTIAACQIMDITRAGIWLYAESEQRLQPHTVKQGNGLPAPMPPEFTASASPALFEWLARGGPLVAHDARHHQLTWEMDKPYLSQHDIRSLLAFPLRMERRIVAILVCEVSGSQRNWTPEDVARGNQLADIATRALLNQARQADQQSIQQLNTELQQANAELERRVASRTAELQQAMNQLVQTEKLAALGSLVAGVAHELNTPLGISLTTATTFGDAAKTLRRKLNEGGIKRSELDDFLNQTCEAASLLEHNAWRAAEMIGNFKQVAVDTASDLRRRFDLATTVGEVLFAIGPRFKHTRHQIHTDIAQGIELDSYPGALEQVLANLINNALIHGFAGKSAGEIRIGASADEQQVQLVFSDDGCGIPAHLQKKVFEPFFTTRFGQGGSGLGLYLVYTLVCGRLAGQIELLSEEGHGARFIITLPRVHPDPPDAPA